ncbi:MAG: toxin-antitoxin system YwqK family antitoxin [Steroidobacteraceae bacterium]
MIWIAFAVLGCHRATREAPLACPAGTILKGAAPPKGRELWCEKLVDGKPVKDGWFIAYADDGGKLIEGSYRDGVQEGEWTTWYENGQRSAVDHYHRGLQDGVHVSWYANGQKALAGTYRAGRREGVWTRWDPSGFTSKSETYAADRVVR